MTKTKMENNQYTKAGDYWERKTAFVMGDMRQRPDLLKLLGNVKEKKVLEGGCGTGFFSRKIVSLGAEVYGCDVELDMLNTAKESEKQNPLGIKYDLCDIKKTIYQNNFFDSVVSVGVLFHLNEDEWKEYTNESFRIIKSGGELVISIEHPFIFTKFSPTRTSKKCWAVHTQLDNDSGYNKSQKFEEKYYKSDGDLFTSNLWHHPLDFTLNTIIDSGFQIKEIHEIMIEKEDLVSEYWGKEYGYPAFIQIKAQKS